MPQHSAGIVMFRRGKSGPEIFLVHPGGPFWARKDEGAWSIPKGLFGPNEEPIAAARREFEEETGFPVEGPLIELGTFEQPGGKVIHTWAVEGDVDPNRLSSNLFELEWPPNSGRTQRFSEADRAGWFGIYQALRKITKGQRQIVEKFRMFIAAA